MFTFLLKYKWRKEQRKWFKHNIDLMKYLKNELNEREKNVVVGHEIEDYMKLKALSNKM